MIETLTLGLFVENSTLFTLVGGQTSQARLNQLVGMSLIQLWNFNELTRHFNEVTLSSQSISSGRFTPYIYFTCKLLQI